MNWLKACRLAEEFGWCKCGTMPRDIIDDEPASDPKKLVDDCPFCERDGTKEHIHCATCEKILRLG